ncbi:type II toxin-antitoxin system Phd/YefM family antitoxin [bacterium]|nr:type II toxin-antitoxin system Phd/YefM family antitoxin [bacterium]
MKAGFEIFLVETHYAPYIRGIITNFQQRRLDMVKELEVKELNDADYLRRVLNRIKSDGDQFILKENGQPEAALLSVDDWELLKKVKADKEKSWEELFENIKEVHALNAGFSAEEVEADVDEAIQELRRGQK